MPNKTKWAKKFHTSTIFPNVRKEETLFFFFLRVYCERRGLYKAESQEIRAGHVTPTLPPRLSLLPSPQNAPSLPLNRKNLGTVSSMS